LCYNENKFCPVTFKELKTNIQGSPDLAVEVLSPSTQKYDRKQKSQLYYANGIKEYWIVDPALQLVEVFISGENEWNRSGIYDEGEYINFSAFAWFTNRA